MERDDIVHDMAWSETVGGRSYCLSCGKRDRAKPLESCTSVQHKNEYADTLRRNAKSGFKRRANLKLDALKHYGGTPPACRCCGEGNVVFLTFHHTGNNGARERKNVRPDSTIGGWDFALWLRKNRWPTGYSVLCWNCNWAIRQLGSCPHQKSRR